MFDLKLLKKMREISWKQYAKLVRPYSFLDFCLVDIDPCSPSGRFYPERAAELVNFCKQNPEFHIVSEVEPSIYINYYIDNAAGYYLADGDNNPDLYFDCGTFLERLKSENSDAISKPPENTPFIDLTDPKTFETVTMALYSSIELIQNKKFCESSLRNSARKVKK